MGRDYKDEYKKFQSSKKMKDYRVELNNYNRQHGNYGNGDNKDATHNDGKITGYENQSTNRARKDTMKKKYKEGGKVKDKKEPNKLTRIGRSIAAKAGSAIAKGAKEAGKVAGELEKKAFKRTLTRKKSLLKPKPQHKKGGKVLGKKARHEKIVKTWGGAEDTKRSVEKPFKKPIKGKRTLLEGPPPPSNKKQVKLEKEIRQSPKSPHVIFSGKKTGIKGKEARARRAGKDIAEGRDRRLAWEKVGMKGGGYIKPKYAVGGEIPKMTNEGEVKQSSRLDRIRETLQKIISADREAILDINPFYGKPKSDEEILASRKYGGPVAKSAGKPVAVYQASNSNYKEGE